MNFKISYNGKVKRPKIFLRNPNLDGIGMLKTSDKLAFELNANDICTLEFNIYKKLDGKDVTYYNLVEEGCLIEAESLGVYWIVDVDIVGNGKNEYKEVKCRSLDYELKRRKIFDISGVYYLYNIANQEKSLMHVISNELGNWSIGHIDNQLIGLARTFDIDSAWVYDLLTDNLSISFEAIFQFDYYHRTISAYTIENFGKRVNIVLSYRNLVQQNIVSTSLENVITCFRVKGGNDLDIRAITPTLSDKIYNYGFFMVKKSEGGKVTDGLVDAWNTYQTKYITLSATQTTNITQLKAYQAEILNLNEKEPSIVTTDWTQYGLTGLKTKKSVYELLESTLLSNGAGSKSSPQHSEYTANHSLLLSVEAEIIVRTTQISAKQAQIDALNVSISGIASQLLFTNNFTSDQIKELKNITFEDEYIDSTYVVSDADSEETALEIKQQLYNVANTELNRVCQPQYTIDTTIANLFMLPEFKNYQGDFWLGNIISIKFNKDYVATVRLLSIKIDFEKPEDLSVVFSNRNKLDSSTIDFAKIQEQASQTSNSMNISGAGWDKAAKQVRTINSYMTDALNLATQELWSSDNQEFVVGAFGARCREKNITTGLFDPEQLWITKNKIVFSDDSFNSAKTCFGKYIYNGTTYYGLIGEAVVSPLIISEHMYLYNQAGNYSIDNNGFTASATVGTNTYVAGINPSTPNHILYASVNGQDKFYIDTITNQLVMTGTINATGGTITGNLTVTGKLSGGTIEGSLFDSGRIVGSSIDIGDGNFTVSSLGVMTARNGTFSGNIEASTITGSTIQSIFDINDGTITLAMDSGGYSVEVSTSTGLSSISTWLQGSIDFSASSSYAKYGRTGIQLKYSGSTTFYADTSTGDLTCRDISCNSINSDSHTHSQYASKSALNSLEDRVTALGG
jgi:hypothetical protein